MTPLSEKILSEYQVRKTRDQKTAFIDMMTQAIPGLRVEEGGFLKNRNLVLGDPATARVIITAHYDTCARMLLPNLIAPKNIPLSLLYSLAICLPFVLLAAVLSALLVSWTDSVLISWLGSMIPAMALLFYFFMGGKPNPHTANDNTSGVVVLCQLIEQLPQEVKQRCCFVFFDNEELGLLGSSYFRKRHKEDGVEKKVLVNFDCVSDGRELLFVLSKAAKAGYEQAFRQAFPSEDGYTVHIEPSSTTLYPSDQVNFPLGVGVAALKRKRLVGLYMGKIHTIHDTVFQRENIQYLTDGTRRLLERI